jgi:hypothetical protein
MPHAPGLNYVEGCVTETLDPPCSGKGLKRSLKFFSNFS